MRKDIDKLQREQRRATTPMAFPQCFLWSHCRDPLFPGHALSVFGLYTFEVAILCSPIN